MGKGAVAHLLGIESLGSASRELISRSLEFTTSVPPHLSGELNEASLRLLGTDLRMDPERVDRII